MTFVSPTDAPDSIRAQAVEKLITVVTNGVVVYLAAQDAHWNVKGPNFGPLHALFGEVYATVHGIVDRAAERAVTLGGTVSGLSVVGSRPALAEVPPTNNTDGLVFCANLAALVTAYAAQVDEAYRAVEGLRLTADANALQDAVEALEKLGWMLAAHTVTS